MTRYARGKGTHQRVVGDSTPWKELKETPSKDDSNSKRFKRVNKAEPEGQSSSSGGDGVQGANKKKFSKNFKSGGNGKNSGAVGDRWSFPKGREAGEGQESANFMPLGGNPNVKGIGQSKQVKIMGQYWVGPEDARRLQGLVKKLKAEGLPRKDIVTALQGERRKAEKASKRRRDKTCFNCRQFGHVLSDCPNSKKGGEADGDNVGASSDGDICFKCGSTEHTSRYCKKKGDKFSFASCFVCSQSGHIARQCPKNTKGIYPTGGCCDECGSIAHLRRDCPDLVGRVGDDDKLGPVVSRISDPYLSTEYEEVPEEPEAVGDEDGNNDVNLYANKKTKKSIKSGKRKLQPEEADLNLDFGNDTNEMKSAPIQESSLLKPPAVPVSAIPAKKRVVKF